MNRNDLVKHLKKHRCRIYREGGSHSIFLNDANGNTAAVPRHMEIPKFTVRRICETLDVPKPKGS